MSMRFAAFAPLALFCATALAQSGETKVAAIGPHGAFSVVENAKGKWGIVIRGMGTASAEAKSPIAVMLSAQPGAQPSTASYRTIKVDSASLWGTGELQVDAHSRVLVVDLWTVNGDVLRLQRQLTVHGSAGGEAGFDSGILLEHQRDLARSDFAVFAPGLIYGSPAHLTSSAIGGADTFSGGGSNSVFIREDRMPAPLYGVRFQDGSSLAILHSSPDGATTARDSHDTAVISMTDPAFAFASIGNASTHGRSAEGFWYPGSEGEVTYRGNTYPGGQEHRWRYRYHPLRDGFTQHYELQIRFSNFQSFPAFARDTWRWAYAALRPQPVLQNIEAVEADITGVLAGQAVTVGDRTGIPNSVSAASSAAKADDKAVMGFTGKNLEAAEFLLAESDLTADHARSEQYRRTGLAIFQSFLRLQVAPPAGEGFSISTGQPVLAIPRTQRVYLRSFSDDMKAVVRAYNREKRSGRAHPEWLAWARQFADWLLTQQTADGSFPRAWAPGSGAVVDRSPQSSYNPIPFLLFLTQASGDPRYAAAAVRAGEFSWNAGQASGQFVGGTIDNPDILDKEAGTLSLEAYLALYDFTHETQWLSRAQGAADYAETYIYLWNVPMPSDQDDSALHWKRQASTVGTQLIATGHSLTDDYMSFDVDSYARLSKLTHDAHYLDVARLLLHGTKAMVATADHPYDLRGPGWQQEHWSFAPTRGFGLHRLWLPWVATSQLRGIIALREDDPALFKALTRSSQATPGP